MSLCILLLRTAFSCCIFSNLCLLRIDIQIICCACCSTCCDMELAETDGHLETVDTAVMQRACSRLEQHERAKISRGMLVQVQMLSLALLMSNSVPTASTGPCLLVLAAAAIVQRTDSALPSRTASSWYAGHGPSQVAADVDPERGGMPLHSPGRSPHAAKPQRPQKTRRREHLSRLALAAANYTNPLGRCSIQKPDAQILSRASIIKVNMMSGLSRFLLMFSGTRKAHWTAAAGTVNQKMPRLPSDSLPWPPLTASFYSPVCISCTSQLFPSRQVSSSSDPSSSRTAEGLTI